MPHLLLIVSFSPDCKSHSGTHAVATESDSETVLGKYARKASVRCPFQKHRPQIACDDEESYIAGTGMQQTLCMKKIIIQTMSLL